MDCSTVCPVIIEGSQTLFRGLCNLTSYFFLNHNLAGVNRAVDLCAAPGSWSQVLARGLKGKPRLQPDQNEKGNPPKIVAVDIQTMAPIDGVTMIQGDITSFETAKKVISHFEGDKAQLVVCDGAPDVTGQHDLDEFMQCQLLLAALNITSFIIEEGGTFVAKIFRGKDISLKIEQFGLFFEQVQVIKPKSSRISSIESFLVCRNFHLSPGYKPQMFDILTDFSKTEYSDQLGDSTTEQPNIATYITPFLMCGDLNQLRINTTPGEE